MQTLVERVPGCYAREFQGARWHKTQRHKSRADLWYSIALRQWQHRFRRKEETWRERCETPAVAPYTGRPYWRRSIRDSTRRAPNSVIAQSIGVRFPNSGWGFVSHSRASF